jgi:hypothetical protein
MKTMAKLIAFALTTLGASNQAHAYRMDLWLFITGSSTWELRGSTDAPGGIASYQVNLSRISTTSFRRAPRWNGPDNQLGFTLGQNNPQLQANGGLQVFAGQNWSGETLADDGVTIVQPVVWGIGYDPDPIVSDTVPTGTATPTPPPGTGVVHIASTGNPTQIPVLLHQGTYTPGLVPYFHPVQPTHSGLLDLGTVWSSVGATAPIGVPSGLFTFYHPLPEPSAIFLIATAIPALALAIHRRRLARRKSLLLVTS